MTKCEGVITRKRITEGRVEESIIDFLIISSDLVNDFAKLIIDEMGEHALTKITHGRNSVQKVSSDHNVMISNFNLTVQKSETPKKVEVFDLKIKQIKKILKKQQAHQHIYQRCLKQQKKINFQNEQSIKRLNKCIHKSFKEIRILKRKPGEYEKLYAKWTELKHKEDNESKLESIRLEAELADKFGDNIFDKIKDEIQDMNCEDG